MNILKTIALSVPVIFAGAVAQSAVVNFDGISEGTNMLGGFDFGDGLTGTISSSHLGSNATGDVLICDTSTVGSECRENDPDLRSDFSAAPTSDEDLGSIDFGNALILEEAGGGGTNVDDAWSGGRITFTFDTAVDLVRLAILDGNDNPLSGGSIYLDGVLFDTNRGGGDNEYDIVWIGKSVTSFSVDFAGSGAIGAFEAAAVIPLPASAMLLLGGIGTLGALRRRKKS